VTAKGEHYEMHSNAVKQKALHEVRTQKKSIQIIADLNGVPASTLHTWVRQAGLDRGRPAYCRRDNDARHVKLPSKDELAEDARLMRAWK